MATSPAKIEANRRNAQKSTGPTTEAGRKAASRNALRHGLTAEALVVLDETPEDFAAHYAAMRAALAPVDEVEEQLVERIAFCAWRLRRAGRAEAEIVTWQQKEEAGNGGRFGPAYRFVVRDIATLMRYESTIERAYHRAHLMLERRQARRRGESVPAPIAVQVEGMDVAANATVTDE
jgi:hypothetical protein